MTNKNNAPADGRNRAIVAAALDLGVPYDILHAWCLNHLKLSDSMWSRMRSGDKGLGKKHTERFLRERVRELEVERAKCAERAPATPDVAKPLGGPVKRRTG